MHRVQFVFGFAVLWLLSAGCGGDGISSGGSGGQIGSGGISTIDVDAGTGGSIGTGGGIGSGGAADAPISTGTGGGTGGTTLVGGTSGTTVVSGKGGTVVVSGTGGTTVVSGTGGTTVVSGTGGTTVASGTGGTPVKLDAGPGEDSGTGPDSGAGGAPGCDKDLSGTWDLFASSLGTGIVRGTLIVSKDGFSLTANDCQLTYNAQGSKSAIWKYTSYSGSTTRLISVQNTPAAANTGSVPLAVGGHWVLQSNTETCTVDVSADKVTGSCKGPVGDTDVAAVDWPAEILPSPDNGVNYTVSRSNTLASQFGDFGGNWIARSDAGGTQGCAFKLEGNTGTTSCKTDNSFNGALHLTVGADCVASGVTPSGLEVSARRR